MFFFLHTQHSFGQTPRVKVLEQESVLTSALPDVLYLQKGKQSLVSLSCAGGQLILLGDPIGRWTASILANIVSRPGQVNEDQLYLHIKGHYNWFYLHEQGWQCGSAFGAIFPVYYRQQRQELMVSSSSFYVANQSDNREPDRQNLLERLLFNYPVFDSTWWTAVKRLPAHRILRWEKGGVTIIGDFALSDYFGAPRQRSASHLQNLCAFFQEEITAFFPDECFGVSFTGGFDGRTLVAASRQAQCPFFTYSFGRPDSTDLSLPSRQARQLGVDYQPILLDDNYVQQYALPAAHRWMQRTEYNGNYGRPHYEYAARQLAKRTNYILTGNFGSELFRALHIAGVMMSEHLIDYFACPDDSWKDRLQQKTLSYSKTYFKEALETLISDLTAYRKQHQGWNTNQWFYQFVFSELFRKYFGPELIMQSTYLRNRTPYLNLSLFRELNHTIWSGVHARMFEKWKVKRLKGQTFYAAFIHRADPVLYHLKTNKGYSPADVGDRRRWLLLLGKVLWKKLGPSKEIDDNATQAFFLRHAPALLSGLQSIKQDDPLSTHLASSPSRLTKRESISYWIKLYSIAAGWQAARQKNVLCPTTSRRV